MDKIRYSREKLIEIGKTVTDVIDIDEHLIK